MNVIHLRNNELDSQNDTFQKDKSFIHRLGMITIWMGLSMFVVLSNADEML